MVRSSLLLVGLTLILLPTRSSYAQRVTRTFGTNNSIRVISDKGFSYPEEKKFRATGNVVISYGQDAIYGEQATLNLLQQKIVVVGNVRYIGPEITFYGSKLIYNMASKQFEIFNARVLSDNFVVLGNKIKRISDQKIYAEGAEYTTCRDCPESWTIFGKSVTITPHQYVQIKHAYLKAKGIVFMYIPYILFPIKTKRESGVLVPKISFQSNEGLYFQQPYFWAINRSSDMTITPSYFGSRGLGFEYEYRKIFTPKKWIYFNTLALSDRMYQPNDSLSSETELSGKHYFRHYSSIESHYDITPRLQNHTYATFSRDSDMSRIFDKYVEPRELGSEQQVKTTFDYRGNLFQFDALTTFNKNLIYYKSDSFDNGYVQLMPHIDFNMLPYPFYISQLKFLHNASAGFDFSYDHFKQNSLAELSYFRNAKRISYHPYLNIFWGEVGPVLINSKVELDGQHYSLGRKGQESFSKYSILYSTQLKLEVEKIWGRAQIKRIVQPVEVVQHPLETKLVGSLPHVERGENRIQYEFQSAYRHTQTFLLSHYYTTDSKWSGSQRFYNQIQNEEGIFDYKDSLIEKKYLLSDSLSRTTIPQTNTLELQWKNSLTQKTLKSSEYATLPHKELALHAKRYYNYQRIAYLNLSQGYLLDTLGNDSQSRLTRLALSSGVDWRQWHFFLTEYFFYTGSGHILNTGVSYRQEQLTTSVAYNYNYFSVPTNRRLKLAFDFTPIDLINFNIQYDYDFENRDVVESNYRITYSPHNNCWRLALGYQKTLVKSAYAINFLFNFGSGTFSSMN